MPILKMKAIGLSLRMDRPCAEKWSDMQVGAQGRYCDRCSKTVIDMIELKDHEITAILAKSPSTVCARLSTEQVNRPLLARKSKSKIPFYKIASGLFLLSWVNSSLSSPKQLATELTYNNNSVKENNLNYDKPSQTQDSARHKIQGIIRDPIDNSRVSGAFVQVRGTDIKTVTTPDGSFTIYAPIDIPVKDVVLEISHLGYQTITIPAYNRSKKSTQHEIVLHPDENNLIGEVCIVKRKKWWQFWR